MLTCDPGHETMITPQKVNKFFFVNSMWKDELKKKSIQLKKDLKNLSQLDKLTKLATRVWDHDNLIKNKYIYKVQFSIDLTLKGRDKKKSN